ncbi:MAG: hypothetical protein AB1512_02415 [Thermodesulfobacteriota bacterium]
MQEGIAFFLSGCHKIPAASKGGLPMVPGARHAGLHMLPWNSSGLPSCEILHPIIQRRSHGIIFSAVTRFRDVVIIKNRLSKCLGHHDPGVTEVFHVLSKRLYRVFCDRPDVSAFVVECLMDAIGVVHPLFLIFGINQEMLLPYYPIVPHDISWKITPLSLACFDRK